MVEEPIDDFARCAGFMRAFAEALATRIVRGRVGHALLNDDLPLVYDRNVFVVDPAGRPSAPEVTDEADRLLADRRHRKLEFGDDFGGVLAPDLRERGWKATRLLVMARRGVPPPARATTVELDAQQLRPSWEEGIRAEPWGSDRDVVEQLIRARLLRTRAVDVRYFASLEGGEPAAHCELFSDGRTAQIETVFTLPRFRGRGHGRAVVARATAEALARHELAFLAADADDWPRRLYARLGFQPVGTIWDFLREAPAAAD